MKELNLQPLTGRLRSVWKGPLSPSPLSALPFIYGFIHLPPGLIKFRMFGIVALNPTGGTIPLTLKVDEVSGSTVHLAGDAVPEAVKLRHDSRHALV